jgi:hypothetical protein
MLDTVLSKVFWILYIQRLLVNPNMEVLMERISDSGVANSVNSN